MAWAVALAAAAASVFVAGRFAANQQLERAAGRSAMQYARLIGVAVPDFGQWISGGRPPPAALEVLHRLRKVGEIFRFKMFDREGRLVIDSDKLDRPDLGNDGTRLGAHHQNDAEEIGAALRSGKPVVELHRHGSEPGRPAVYSEAYAPVQVDGRTVGVIEAYVDQSELHAEANASMAEVGLAVGGALALLGLLGVRQALVRLRAQHEAEERMRYLARHDVLSGALNRASFNEALAHAAQRRAEGGDDFAVLCVNLDHFKDVNDSFGQAAGDDVLRRATARLRKLMRAGDQLARLNGDEFAILQTGVRSTDDVRALAQRVVDSLAQPFQLVGQPVVCGASVGAALFGADTGNTAELLHMADLALYRAKENGRGNFSFYDAELDAQLRQRRELVAELRSAISAQALELHYQPQLAADGKRLTGYEALLRWPHPRRGQVPPAEFIPLAEDNGMIEALGTWVLNSACREAARWPGELSVAVNLSAAQFGSGNLVEVVKRALVDSGLPARRLELEITESLLIAHTEPVVPVLRTLRQMGVRIAMDDFGTGYSSLSYLWRFPFDKLKIDRAFTQAIAEDARVELIVQSIVSLAHAMRIAVNAEGVENTQQLELLRRHGCDEVQGFLLGRPARPEALLHRCTQPERADARADRVELV